MQPPHTSTVKYAQLNWDQGQPCSTEFDDVYFSRDSGIQETEYVFLTQNRLGERWQQLAPNSRFCIGETGFGTGLNFLAAAQLWLTTAPVSAQLHYISVEKYPLARTDLIQVLTLWPTLAPLTHQLIAQYPPHLETETYQLSLAGGRIQLTLIIADAAEGLAQQLYAPLPNSSATRIDAWFLDGFAPSKNPHMWSEALFATLAALSHPNTSFATFTSAGLVRRGLTQAGFRVEKVPGFGRKREMLRGQYQADHPPELKPGKRQSTWHQYHSRHSAGRAAIIGAGLAGAHTARALAETGWQVTVFERQPAPACEASGNPQGVLYAKLSPQRHPQGRFNLAAYQLATRFYPPLWQSGCGEQCGVIQQLADTEAANAFTRGLPPSLARVVDRSEASHMAGVELSSGGIWLPEAGWLAPARVCAWLLDHPAIRCCFNTQVEALQPIGNNEWRVAGEDYQLVVVCCGIQAAHFEQTEPLPLKSIRGQISQLPVPEPLGSLKCVVTGQGYVAPPQTGQLCTGATFTLRNSDPALREEDHRENLAQLASLFKVPINSDSAKTGRVGFRCTTPDYLPIAGPLPHWQQLRVQFAPLARNGKAAVVAPGQWQQGLMINTGLGSRGLAYAPLTARLIAALAGNLPLPMHQDLIRAISPARFAIRSLIRGQ